MNDNKLSEELIKAIIDEKNVIATLKLEKLLLKKCAKHIDEILNK